MKRERKPESFLHRPEFPGGKEAFKKYIKDQLKYPEEALRNKVQGDVHVKYKISFKGDVMDAEIMKGIGGGCDEEALRLVRSLKFLPQRASSKSHVKVTITTKTVIRFRLPKKKAAQNSIQYSYTGKPSSSSTPKPVVYNYTIQFNPEPKK